MVKALTFDVFGTVVDWRSGVARAARAVAGRTHTSVDWEVFADRWRSLYQPAMQAVRNGERSFVKLDELHRENLDRVIEDFGLGDLDKAAREELNLAWHRLDPWPDTREGLQRLKSRFILATLSNANVSLLVEMAKRARLPWDAVLGAEVTRRYKPQPEAYRRTADLLSLSPDDCMMVAAHNGDLIAAAECGFRTAFVCRPTEHGPGQTIDLRAERAFDIVADDFLDLAKQLGC